MVVTRIRSEDAPKLVLDTNASRSQVPVPKGIEGGGATGPMSPTE